MSEKKVPTFKIPVLNQLADIIFPDPESRRMLILRGQILPHSEVMAKMQRASLEQYRQEVQILEKLLLMYEVAQSIEPGDLKIDWHEEV